MDFDVVDLRLFVAVAQASSITAAAQARHLSLAAASARIRTLERHPGVPLLYRQPRGVRLTPAGEAFLHHARGILRQSEQLVGELLEYGRGLRGHVRVHANTTGVTDILPEVLPAFLKANPNVNIELEERRNAEIAVAVRDGRADLGIVAGEIDAPGLRTIHFSTDRLVLVVPRSHRFARRRSIAFADTLQADHVGMRPGSTLQDFLEKLTAQMGQSLRLRVELSSFEAMCRMIAAGVGIGIVPESSARRHLSAMGLVAVELTDSWRIRERFVLVRAGEPLPAFAQSLVDALQHAYSPPSGRSAAPTGAGASPRRSSR